MLISVRTLKNLINEAYKKNDALDFAQNVENALAKQGIRSSTNIDVSGGAVSVFVRVSSEDNERAKSITSMIAADSGWSLLSASNKSSSFTTLWFEPADEHKQPTRLKNGVLYHVTPAENVQSIMKNGLVPTKRSFSETSRTYEPRVYFATDKNVALSTMNRPGDWALLSLDVSKLPKNVVFYPDVEFKMNDRTPAAVYTTNVVPPNAVSVIDTLSA